MELHKVLVWVKLPKLPFEFWSNDLLSRIANTCGVPLFTDQCTSFRSMLSYARILIEMDLHAPFPKSVTLEDENGYQFSQQIVYEWMPEVCSNCDEVGHTKSNCVNRKVFR